MAFIRRVRTKSGATAVQIAEYAGGKQRIIKHLGSAHTDVELGILLARANELLAADQATLDFEVAPHPPITPVLSQAPQQEELFPNPQQRLVPPGAGGGRDGPGRVQATNSVLLGQVLRGVYAQLGFDTIDDRVFEDLVIARIVEPTSKLDAGRVLDDLGGNAPSYATIKRHLRAVIDQDYRSQIAEKCFAHATSNGDISLILYDVTTLYFEAENEDALRKVGYSKERRVDPQIVVGLLVDRGGFPLEIGCFEGNHAETHTLLPIIGQFQERHSIEDMVIVADAGMLSQTNLAELDEANLRFIVGSRATKAPGDLARHFRWHGDAFDDGQVIDTITPRSGGNRRHDVATKTEPVWDPAEHPKAWRAIWQYSRKRAARDTKTITNQENRALAIINGETRPKNARFVTTTKAGRELDAAALARARRLIGLKGYQTNIAAAMMPATEVISSYHDLWQVEASFRMSKSDLKARPIFARTRDSIEAHLSIVFTALAVSRFIQDRTGLSIKKIVKQLRPLRSATVTINGATQTFPPLIPPELQDVLNAIGTDNLTH